MYLKTYIFFILSIISAGLAKVWGHLIAPLQVFMTTFQNLQQISFCTSQWDVLLIVHDLSRRKSVPKLQMWTSQLLSEAVTLIAVCLTPLSYQNTDRLLTGVSLFSSVSYIRSCSPQNGKFKRAAHCFDWSPFVCQLASYSSSRSLHMFPVQHSYLDWHKVALMDLLLRKVPGQSLFSFLFSHPHPHLPVHLLRVAHCMLNKYLKAMPLLSVPWAFVCLCVFCCVLVHVLMFLPICQ